MVLQALSIDEMLNDQRPALGGGLIVPSSPATFLDCAHRSRPLPEHLSTPWECEGRKITGGCEGLGCFAGIAVEHMTNEPKSLVPRLGRMDWTSFPIAFPVKTDWEEVKLTKLGMVPGLCQHPILPGKVLPGTAPSAEQRGGSCGDGNIPPRG